MQKFLYVCDLIDKKSALMPIKERNRSIDILRAIAIVLVVLGHSFPIPGCEWWQSHFSAGSYRDVSRVANINSTLWSELFLENKDPLISELDILIDNITKIKDAISAEDADALKALLEKGREVKQALGE